MSAPSRYAATGTASWAAPDGTVVPYLLRRFPPRQGRLTALRTHLTGPGERADVIAYTELGDPELSWLLADASTADRPSDLNRPGTAIIVPAGPAAMPIPGVPGGQ